MMTLNKSHLKKLMVLASLLIPYTRVEATKTSAAKSYRSFSM